MPSRLKFHRSDLNRTALPVRTRLRAASSSSSTVSFSPDDEGEGIDDLERSVGFASGSPPFLEGAREAEAPLPSPHKENPVPEQWVCLSELSSITHSIRNYTNTCISGIWWKGLYRWISWHSLPRRRKPWFPPTPEAIPHRSPKARSPTQTSHSAFCRRVPPVSTWTFRKNL